VTGAELGAHYRCWADTFGAVTIVLPCDTCLPDSVYGEVEPVLRGIEKWTRIPIPAVYLTRLPNTEEAYWAGMHELGHLATYRTKDGQHWRRDWGHRRAEAEAWRWPLEHSAVEPTPAMWRFIVSGLESYIWKTKPDPTFYRLLLEATMKGTEE
jgi:hypothetical protein